MTTTTNRCFSLPTLIVISLCSLLLGGAIAYALMVRGTGATTQANRQAMVHTMGGNVMPFDLEKTTHIFTMTETGGIQQVVADNATDTTQVQLIQQHLEHEAQRFSQGDFRDPTTLHGTQMPGVSLLSIRANSLTIRYTPLANGGQIAFEANDITLITAIHQWFGAQLNDHGRDAMSLSTQ